MLKVKKNKVRIKGDGQEMAKDLCTAALAIRDIFAKTNSRYASSAVIVSYIAATLGLTIEIEEVEPDA